MSPSNMPYPFDPEHSYYTDIWEMDDGTICSTMLDWTIVLVMRPAWERRLWDDTQ